MPRALVRHGGSALVHMALLGVLVNARVGSDEEAIAVEMVAAAELPAVPMAGDSRLSGPDESSMIATADTGLRLDDLTIDVARIRERQDTLFPFLTLDLKFLAALPARAAEVKGSLANPYANATANPDRPPLEIDDAEVDRLVDAAWTRRQRWEKFSTLATVLTSHAANSGRAAGMVRLYLDRNILQPYCDGATRDPRFWAMLENAADHPDFIDFVRGFARDHPSSRTTTELLLLLDELAQGNRDVLLLLMETRPDTDLLDTQRRAPDAFALATALKERYGRWLFDRGLDRRALRAAYDDLRLRLLETILATTPDGYRAGDVRYLAGEVLFNQSKHAEAIAHWRAIVPDPDDAYYRAYTDVRRVLESSGAADLVGLRRVLGYEHGRWRVFSIDRLKRFGHACDTF